MSTEKACTGVSSLKPAVMMVFAQVLFAGINICYALAAENGMDLRVLVAYRFGFGAVFLVPVAFFLERKKRSKMTWKVVFYAILCGIFGGSLGQNLFLESLVFTSATYAAAMTNLIPAFTFIVAVCWRLEKLDLNTIGGKAKVIGTVMGIGGAMLFTLYKGPEIILWKTNINLMKLVSKHSSSSKTAKTDGGNNLALGISLSMISCVCYSLWYVFQAKVAAIYPYPQSFTALLLVMATIQSTIVAVCVQHDPQQWKLGWDIRLLTVFYAGVIGSGLMFSLVSYCIRVRGPLFGSIFSPLLLVLVSIVGSLFMDDNLCMGRILGAIVIITGLYIVLWGKSKEMKQVNPHVPKLDHNKVQVDEPLAEIRVVNSKDDETSKEERDKRTGN